MDVVNVMETILQILGYFALNHNVKMLPSLDEISHWDTTSGEHVYLSYIL